MNIRNYFRSKRVELSYYARNGKGLTKCRGFSQIPYNGDHQLFIKPGDSITIMMGVSVRLPDNMGAMVMLNPGMTVVKGLFQDIPEMLHPGYQGDIRIRVTNRGKLVCYITPDACIAMILPISMPKVCWVQGAMKEVDPNGYNQLPD